jgi:hypothetical protein
VFITTTIVDATIMNENVITTGVVSVVIVMSIVIHDTKTLVDHTGLASVTVLVTDVVEWRASWMS